MGTKLPRTSPCDGDGVPDTAEVGCGTDPDDAADVPSADDLADPDGDEVPSCADPDDDGDGLADGDEVASGTDPKSPEAEPETERGPEADPVAEGVADTGGDATDISAEATPRTNASGGACHGGGSVAPAWGLSWGSHFVGCALARP